VKKLGLQCNLVKVEVCVGRKQPRLPLSRERILNAALALADAEGLDAITMRRLGEAMGVEAMSLYKHVTDKDDILDGIVERVLEAIELPQLGDEWRDAMHRRARSARAVFSQHPWAVGLLESRAEHSSPRRLAYFDTILGVLRNAGFSSQLAMRGFSMLDAYIYGYILQEHSLAFRDDSELQEVGTDLMRQMADRYPHLAAVTAEVMVAGYDHAREFAFGVDLILDGLVRQQAAQQG
jgi:AcrR family transcriptional regulator